MLGNSEASYRLPVAVFLWAPIRILRALFAMTVVTRVVAAQGASVLEIGLYGAWQSQEPRFFLPPLKGGGARADLSLSQHWEATFNGEHVSTAGGQPQSSFGIRTASATTMRLGLSYLTPVADFITLLGGLGIVGADPAVGDKVSLGLSVTGGLRITSSLPIAMRIDGQVDMIRRPDVLTTSIRIRHRPIRGFRIGASYVFRRRLPNDGDDDGDSVPNSRDRCPHTPSGRTVNAEGCEK
jgi:hypothetical protein